MCIIMYQEKKKSSLDAMHINNMILYIIHNYEWKSMIKIMLQLY